MWLLDTQTLQLHEIVDPSTVSYAILSHTWEHDEVSFQDISNLESARKKAGFSKISRTCELAREKHIPYAWVDTCCIDKSSSAELSEAINSMFQWYKFSLICFVYLSDLEFDDSFSPFTTKDEERALGECRWFTRGWTLQELIAPNSVIFYNSRWKALATKTEIVESLQRITGIPQAVLSSMKSLRSVPVAVKMSWAAHRQTKRLEDQAYALLGIFGINMPMLYGEGSRAFRRLQEEIARETNDLSLFAWRAKKMDFDGPLLPSLSQEFRGIFARSPKEFVDGAKLRRSASDEDACEFSLANRGVRIDTRFRKGQKGIYVMYLGLSELETGADVCLSLVRTADGFVRSHPWSLSSDINKSFPENRVLTAYVRKDVDIEEEWQIRRRRRSIHINISLPPSLHIDYINPHPRQFWDEFFHTFLIPHPEEDFGATVDFGVKEVDSRLNTKYPMRLTLGWSTMSDVFHADIHTMGQPASEQEKGPEYKTPGRRMVPGGLSDGVGKWLSVHARSRPQKVYFVDEDSDSQPQGSRDKTARITIFEISVETCDELDGTEYYVLVTGQVERMDLENDRFRVLLTPWLTERVPYMMNPPAYPDLFQGSAIEVSTTTSLSLSTDEAPTDYVLTTPHIQ